MTLPELDKHTTSVVARLSAAGIRTGDGQRPDDGGWQGAEGASAFNAYCIVYPLPGTLDGPITRVNDDFTGEWQTTSVSRDRHGAQVVSDRCKQALLDGWRSITIAGRSVMPVTYAGGGDVRRDDSTSPPLFYAVDRFRISTTPS